MDTNKELFSIASRLVSVVDLIKWTSTFGEGMITQMESPLSGIHLSPGLSHLFALGRDDIGWMLIMDEKEGAWLEHLPVSSVLMGASDGIILITGAFDALEEAFAPVGIDIFIPQIDLREKLSAERLIGFALRRQKNGDIERVSRIVPIMTVDNYKTLSNQVKAKKATSLFAA